MSGLVRVNVNGRWVEVPPGTLVTDAAKAAEVHVPIFCSHSKLPPLGACRICVVEVGTPRLGPDRKPVLAASGEPEIAWMPKVQTGCTTRVSEGMHVRTESKEAVHARKGVMEFLLVNHPLDCPVCDEGGECQLQDLAFAFGADFSRMDEAKRTFESESLGPIVKKEANRCIVCMRCVRYCDEIMGEDALTAHQRGFLTEISSFNRQPLECEQCGNCIEVCPVGALTALPYRFKARPWDLRQQITVCPHCSNGCSVRLGVRGMEVLRARGTEDRGVNGEYLCARGRFGHEFVNSTERLSSALLRIDDRLQPTSFDETVAWAAARLREIVATHGPGAVAFLGGEKLYLEEQYLFQKLARAVLGTPHVDARTRFSAPVPGAALLEATGGGRPLLTFEELGHCQEVLVLGDDLQAESPFSQAVLIRGQHQTGLHLTVAHPRRVKLARTKFGGDWLALRPGSELALLNGLAREALGTGAPAGLPDSVAAGLGALETALAPWTKEATERATGVPAPAIAAAVKRLKGAERKAILFGRAWTEHPQAASLAQAIQNLGWLTGALTAARSSVLYTGAQSNSQGALDMGLTPDALPGYVPVGDAAARKPYEQGWGATLPGGAGLAAPQILEAAASGKIRALWIASDDWLAGAPDRALAEKALETCELVLVNELFLTATAQRAHAVFAVSAFAEKEGVAVNCERRLQRAVRALPPRRGTRPDWEVFQAVGKALGANWNHRASEEIFREIVRLVPAYKGISLATLLPNGRPWAVEGGLPGLGGRLAALAEAPDGKPAGDESLMLLTGGNLFVHGGTTWRGTVLSGLAGQPVASVHPDEAKRRGLAAGDRVALEGPAGMVELPVAADEAVPPGSVFVSHAYLGLGLNRLGAPKGGGLRVRLRKAAVTEKIGV